MSASMEVMPPGGHETYATSIFSKIKTYLDSNPYEPVKDVPNTPIAIATFDDGSDLPMPKLEVAIGPQQEGSGDPSPTNVRPIIGWDEANVTRTGKNLFDRNSIRRGVYTKEDGTTQSGSATTNFSSQFIKVKPNTIYSITMFGESYENGSLFGIYYDENKNGLKQSTNILRLISNESKTFTTPSNAHYIVFTGYRGAGTDIFTTANTMVCEGTPTEYEPYNGQTYNIQFKDGDNPLTVYGGSLDVVSGVLVVDRVEKTVDDCSWYGSKGFFYTGTVMNEIVHDDERYDHCISDVYATKNVGTSSELSDGEMSVDASGYLQLKDARYSSTSDFKTAMGTSQLVYELATPITYQLTPQQVKSLLGQNNVWADTGDVLDAEYIRDKYDNMTAKYAAYAYNSGDAISASRLGSSNIGSATQPIYLNGGTATACTYTLGKSVPSDAVFTDTKVTQTATDVSSNAEYEVLFSETADDTTRTEGTRKTSLFTFNPQTNEVAAGHFAAKSDSPSGNKTANLLGYDIQLGGTSNTWDGMHTSLKDTIEYLNSHFAPSAHDHNYLVSAGTNTQSTSSTEYALGSFNVRWFTQTGKIPHQPSQWGFLLTVATETNSAENHQIFVEQANGNLYHRGTNASSSSNPPAFKTILDSSNYTSYTRNSSGVIKVNSVTKTPTNAGTSLASPKPLIDSGYKFLCWLYVQSNGYIVGANYPGGAANPSATWWFANGYLANYALTFYYLEIKDTI